MVELAIVAVDEQLWQPLVLQVLHIDELGFSREKPEDGLACVEECLQIALKVADIEQTQRAFANIYLEEHFRKRVDRRILQIIADDYNFGYLPGGELR